MSNTPHRFTYASAVRYEQFIDHYVSTAPSDLHIKPFDQTLETFATKFRDAMTGLFHGHWISDIIDMPKFREYYPVTVVAIRDGKVLVTTKERYKEIRKVKETLHHIEAKVNSRDPVLSVVDISNETLHALAHLHHLRILLKPTLVTNPPHAWETVLSQYDVDFEEDKANNTLTII